MQNISSMEDIKKPKQRVLSKFICDECGEKVKETELVIPVGPRKGETIVANYGCKCADIKLAEQAMKLRAEIRNNKMKRSFDYYSLVNESLQQATLANYEPTSELLANAKQSIEQYVSNFNGRSNLLLHGSFGTGKSHLSVSTTKELMEKGYECLFLSLPKLLTKIKDTYNNKGVTEDELLEVIQRVDLLVLDDIGAENKTEWTVSKVFEIMDGRSGKSTIYTTNLSSKELRAQIGERNFSRMMENTEIITMNGRDYRRKEF